MRRREAMEESGLDPYQNSQEDETVPRGRLRTRSFDRPPSNVRGVSTSSFSSANNHNKYYESLEHIVLGNHREKKKLGIFKRSQHLLPRLVLRNRPFQQSSNKVHIQHNQGYGIYKLLRHNWFHTFLRFPTRASLLFLMSVWTSSIIVFASIYVAYDHINDEPVCGLGRYPEGEEDSSVRDPITFGAAFALSLETCTTVGYGLPNGINSYFEKCGVLQVIIYFQMAYSMVFNAFLLAFLYARLGRAETRSNQVIHSSKALVSIIDGQVRFQVRLFDADSKHPVVEAHVRLYCVMNHRPVPRPLRLLQPNDELGGMLFLSFPTVISHHIDVYSILHPSAEAPLAPSGLILRQVDGVTSNRDDVICPVCGESFGTLERWKNHVQYQQIVETKDNFPLDNTHRSLDLARIKEHMNSTPITDLDTLKDYFRENVSEIICVVEGIDPLQSGTFQALQSYRFEDIVWDENSQFAPCLTITEGKKYRKTGERIFQVDLNRYHDIVLDRQAVAAQKREEKEEAAMRAASVDGGPPSSVHGGEVLSDGDLSAAPSSDHPPEPAPVLGEDAPNLDYAPGVPFGDGEEDVSTEINVAVQRSRHRRVKTSSRRPGDALFVPTEEEKQNGVVPNATEV